MRSEMRRWRLGAMLLTLATVVACRADESAAPPSIVLVVFDTTRFDAVSANGRVRATTPVIDALADRGLRYTRAYANSSWTLPSHASLFTGLLPSAHGVGWPNTWAPDDLLMLAERLQQGGYETVGISENPWIGPDANMSQGFDRFTVPGKVVEDFRETLEAWLATRRTDRPFFLFVNLMDAHAPYRVRDVNPFVPCCVDKAVLRALPPFSYAFMCRTHEHETELQLQRALYLGGVEAADEKLEIVLASLAARPHPGPLVTVVTADHGELFGEHGFVDHLFGVHEELIHIPLVVHGLPRVSPAVLDEPVQILDMVPSMLAWAHLPPADELEGRPLPTRVRRDGPTRTIVAEWIEPHEQPPVTTGELGFLFDAVLHTRRQCTQGEHVLGSMRAAIRYPYKLYWYEHDAPELYDLAKDPAEARNLASSVSAPRRGLLRKLAAAARVPTVSSSAPPAGAPSPAAIERLRALGYVHD